MRHLKGLKLIERLALHILHRSPRLGLVIAKPYMENAVSWSIAEDDEIAQLLASDLVDARDLDPPSLRFERLFHLPAYGEEE